MKLFSQKRVHLNPWMLTTRQVKNARAWEFKSFNTLQHWHVLFQKSGKLFNNSLSSKIGQQQLPPFLESNPSVCEAIKLFCRSHIDRLSVEVLHNHIIGFFLKNAIRKFSLFYLHFSLGNVPSLRI